MYSEETVVDKIEVLEDGQIQVRKAIRVLKDGVKISETYHRHVVVPGDDLSKEDAKVQAIAEVVHTKECVNKFRVTIAKKING